MIGFFLIYIIGRTFYRLAGEFGKHQWGYGLLGVASYYVGQVIGAILIMLGFFAVNGNTDIDLISESVLTFGGVILGGIICWLFYQYLKKIWSRNNLDSDPELLDDDFVNN